MFKALSNPQRLRIFLKLAECGCSTECVASDDGSAPCVGDLGENLGIVQSTVSHHIKELRQSGLMQVERRAQKIECWANADALRTLAAFFGNVVADLEHPATKQSASTGRR